MVVEICVIESAHYTIRLPIKYFLCKRRFQTANENSFNIPYANEAVCYSTFGILRDKFVPALTKSHEYFGTNFL